MGGDRSHPELKFSLFSRPSLTRLQGPEPGMTSSFSQDSTLPRPQESCFCKPGTELVRHLKRDGTPGSQLRQGP